MANIYIYDEFSPEDTAMMQALYSRSPKSVTEHVDKVKSSGSGKFMETFYVGYGHASIADCGSTTIFIEGISILADKAIQDWQLYSGQETSTRYIDMGKQAIIDPINTPESQKIIQRWMDFYINNQEKVQEHLMKKYPRKPEEDEIVYTKAIKARCFDITRGFLPAGITTQLSWHTNLRQAYDKICWLRNNPLPEVQKIAENILEQLKEKYKNSFSQPIIDEQENYRKNILNQHNFLKPKKIEGLNIQTDIKNEDLEEFVDIINNRPAKTGLPGFLGELGTITFEFIMDFGSFRDVQRHRNGICRMPLLTTELGFNDWYLEQLPEDLKHEATELIKKQQVLIEELEATPEIKQYYTAMGFNVFCRTTYNLPSATYVIELRSGKPVHPTLRKIAHEMYYSITKKLPNLKLNCDLEPDDWDYRRGLQDIIKK
ncbi:MAG TPA: FAD-dependent thymidylate synthase [bacterium]|nr:FAD-dependent thymidylate synthase [bacterium]